MIGICRNAGCLASTALGCRGGTAAGAEIEQEDRGGAVQLVTSAKIVRHIWVAD